MAPNDVGRRAVVLGAVALAVLFVAGGAHAQRRPSDRLWWMAGCWERRTTTGVVVEQWMAPSAGMMLGAGRTVRRDSVVEYELLRISERRDTLVYYAQPSGQAPAEFRGVLTSDSSITFENAAHDFPQRISYARGRDSLFARIEGTQGGRTRGVDFRYARSACAPAAPPGSPRR